LIDSKLAQVRDAILWSVDSGEYPKEKKIPSSRSLSSTLGVSFAIVQQAVNSLENDGILECLPRKGSLVRKEYPEMLLRNQFSVFNSNLFWMDDFRKLFLAALPECSMYRRFNRGIFELRTSMSLQANYKEFLDLNDIAEEIGLYNSDLFMQKPFESFRHSDGAIYGLPFTFSPKIIFCNKNILENAGCKIPAPGWSYDEFIECVKTLRRSFPPEAIINYDDTAHIWNSWIFHFGGSFFSDKGNVEIDSPKTLKSVTLLRELKDEIGITGPVRLKNKDFCENKLAFLVSERTPFHKFSDLQKSDYCILPFPKIEGIEARVVQATDVICIRKECANRALQKSFIKFMFSEKAQDYISSTKYEIPVRKDSAMKSIDLEDNDDMVCLNESNHMTAKYLVDSPGLMNLVNEGFKQLIFSDKPVEPELRELAAAVRLYRKIQKNSAIEISI